jgi:hypothetical protein
MTLVVPMNSLLLAFVYDELRSPKFMKKSEGTENEN